MNFKKRKSKLERLEQQIQACEELVKNDPDNKILQEQLLELKHTHISAMLKNIKILDEFIRNENESNHYLEEEEL